MAIVAGGGLGGIAAALRLRAKGYRVRVFERGSRMGGRALVLERDGFRHEGGPAVITAPFLLEELFQLFGKRLSDYVTLIPLSPWCRFWFSDHTTLDYGGTLAATQAAMARFDAGDAGRFAGFMEHSQRLFEAGFTGLADQPAVSLRAMGRQMPRLIGLGAHRTLWHTVCKFIRNPKLRQALSASSLLAGANPFQAGSIHGLSHYMEFRWGVHFARGGTGAVIDALTRLMLEEGIDIRLNTTVSKIVIEAGKVKGVELERGGMAAAGLVISNADAMHLYGAMVPAQAQPLTTKLKRRAADLSMGLFVLYFGTSRPYPLVPHRTVWFGLALPRAAGRHLPAAGAVQRFHAVRGSPHGDG